MGIFAKMAKLVEKGVGAVGSHLAGRDAEYAEKGRDRYKMSEGPRHMRITRNGNYSIYAVNKQGKEIKFWGRDTLSPQDARHRLEDGGGLPKNDPYRVRLIDPKGRDITSHAMQVMAAHAKHPYAVQDKMLHENLSAHARGDMHLAKVVILNGKPTTHQMLSRGDATAKNLAKTIFAPQGGAPAPKAAAQQAMQRGPRGGMYRLVNGNKVYGK